MLALTSILHVFSNAAKLALFGRHIKWKLLLLLGIPGVLLVVLGASLSRPAAFRFTELILGLFLILFSLLLLFKPDLRLAATRLNAITCGGIAGFLAGLIGTGGAVRGLVLAAFDLEKNVFVATSAAIDTGVDFGRMIIYLRNGYLTQEWYWLVPSLLVIAFLGSYVGKLLLSKIPQERFRKIVLLFVLAIGVTTFARFFIQSVH